MLSLFGDILVTDAWGYLQGDHGDAWSRLSVGSGTAYSRLYGISGDAWERLTWRDAQYVKMLGGIIAATVIRALLTVDDMGQIINIESQIKGRLTADLPGVERLVKTVSKPDGSTVDVPLKVGSYPKKPTESGLKTLAAAGAVLTRFVGSRYGSPRDVDGVRVQDRDMTYEVLCLADSLLDEDAAKGVYEILDAAADRLVGFQPADAVGAIVLLRDDYVQETAGTWEYGILVSLTAQKVRLA